MKTVVEWVCASKLIFLVVASCTLQVALSVSLLVSVSLPTHCSPPTPLYHSPPHFPAALPRRPDSSARILRRQLWQPQQPGCWCLFNIVCCSVAQLFSWSVRRFCTQRAAIIVTQANSLLMRNQKAQPPPTLAICLRLQFAVSVVVAIKT